MIDRKLVKEVNNSLKYVILSVFVQWLSLLCNILIIFKLANVVTSVLEQGIERQELISIFLYLLVLIAIRFGLSFVNMRMSYLASENVKLSLRDKIYAQVLRLGPSYTQSLSTSELVQVSVEGVDQLEIYFGRYLPQFFYSLLAPLTLFVVISFINFPSAIILFICVPLIPISIIFVQKFAKKLLSKYWGQYTSLGDSFLENIEGLTTLKIYQADNDKNDEMNVEAEHFRKVTMKVLFMQLNSISVMDLIAYGGAALGVIIASQQYLNGSLSFAYAIAIILLASEFFIPMRLLGSYFHIAMNGMAASDKIFSLLELEVPSYGESDKVPSVNTLSLNHLSYQYIADRDVLSNLQMTFKQGFNAIVGESGSGKSTLAKLLNLQLLVYEGTINLNEFDIKSFSFKAYNQAVTVVNHNSYLFKGTVASNLLVGNPKASTEALWSVLKQVKLDEFCRSLQGLETLIETAGTNLSGGQRQRLSIARALLTDAQIYIFDEATSNIDAQSEEAIMELVQTLSKSKIVIVISHRLQNIIAADQICVLDSGTLIELGNHSDLMRNQSKYYDLYQTQHVYEAYAKEVAHEN